MNHTNDKYVYEFCFVTICGIKKSYIIINWICKFGEEIDIYWLAKYFKYSLVVILVGLQGIWEPYSCCTLCNDMFCKKRVKYL